MFNYNEYHEIAKKISKTSKEMKKHYKGGTVAHSIYFDLLAWLRNNGGYVLVKKEKIALKTQTNIVETYIAKWGVKFEITSCQKYHKCIDFRLKLL